MLRRFSLMITLLLCLAPVKGYPEAPVRVLVLPFAVNAQDNLAYLQTEIPAILAKHLTQAGAVVVTPADGLPDRPDTGARPLAEVLRAGKASGADQVVAGALTRIGRRFSLDAYLAPTDGSAARQVFFAEGEGLESLLGTVKKLADDLIARLLRHQRVAQIVVAGNERIETDAVLKRVKTQAGDAYQPKALSEDLKSVYGMGYFDDVRVESEAGPDGKKITFRVKEKPTIRHLKFKGNRVFDDKELKEALNIRTGSILNVFKIQKNIGRIEDLYKEKNYHNVQVTYTVKKLENNQGDLLFQIEEGKKVKIKEIVLDGNVVYEDKELKKIIQSSEKGFFSWLTGSGELDREALKQDAALLTAFYHNNGYIQARVGEPSVTFEEDWIFIQIKIEEGPRFKVGRVAVDGDLILPEAQLVERLRIAESEYYSRELVRNDILVMTDLYSDEGYAYADIYPQIDRNVEKLEVDITYRIKKGKQVYFEKIIIGGNTKTRDKVIRRELRVYEQELYSGRRLKRGIRDIYRLDFFGDVKVDTSRGSTDDSMILKIDVAEKSTGLLSFGGGYSSTEHAYLMGSVSQRNLFGRGQNLELKAELGGQTDRYTLSFTEPWLFDIPLSAGFDLYNQMKDYDDYEKESKGGGVRFSYPVFDYTRLYLSYAYDVSDISDVLDSAAETIKDLEGRNISSSVTTSLRYDSRDRIFNPTEGSTHRISVQYAGLGGDIAFTKYLAETGWYLPLYRSLVGFLHARTGYVRENSGGVLPDYERFYLGGMNSVRGYDWRDISPVDDEGAKIGGDKFVQFNAELLIPLIKEQGVVGVLFVDAGNAYDNDEAMDLGNLRKSAGYGFRWYSPIGPIRIECGYIIDPKEGESTSGNWEFSMGQAF